MSDDRAVRLAQRAAGLAAGAGVDLPDSLLLWQLAGVRPDAAPMASEDPAAALDEALEASLDPVERRRGAHHTPRALADRVAAMSVSQTMPGSASSGRQSHSTADETDGRTPGTAGTPRRETDQPGEDGPAPTIVDPACGGGALLLATARRLVAAGLPVDVVARDLLWGADISSLAAAVTEAAITLWSGGTPPAAAHVVIADTLLRGRAAWATAPANGFDVLVANPPFQAQMGRGTRRPAQETAALRERFGDVVATYVDTAALFLLAGSELVRRDGAMAMILPQSVAGSRDAATVRTALSERAELVELWVPDEPPFEASVHVCVAVLAVHGPSTSAESPLEDPDVRIGEAGVMSTSAESPLEDPDVRIGEAGVMSTSAESLLDGPEPRVAEAGVMSTSAESPLDGPEARVAGPGVIRSPRRGPAALRQAAEASSPAPAGHAEAASAGGAPRRAADWAGRLATARGVPVLDLGALCGTVGDLATAVAGFRDEYYGLVGHVREADGRADAPLVTSGSIDVGTCTWGDRPVRFAKQRWHRPDVDLGGLREANPRLASWIERIRRPKVLVASQTRVIEAWADIDGSSVPVTPLVSVVPYEPGDVGRIAAALCAPPVAVWAVRRAAGTALSPDAIRVSAALLSAAPLPTDPEAWDAAVAALRRRDLARYAELATEMYGLRHGAAADVIAWWRDNLPA